MINSHVGCPLPTNLSLADIFNKCLGDLIIRAFNCELKPMTRLEQDAVGPNLDIEFIYFIGFKGLPSGVEMDRLPGSCGIRIESAL